MQVGSLHEWPGQTENNVKVCLTVNQVIRLLCVLGQRRLCIVRSIQALENAHDKPYPAHRTVRASASCRRRLGGFAISGSIGAPGLASHAGALNISSTALVAGSRMIPFAESGQCPIANLKRGDLFEFFEFAHLCGDGSLAGIELLPL